MRCPYCRVVLLVCAVTLLQACNTENFKSPPGYDFARSDERELGKTLNEISGVWYNSDDSSLLCVSDSKRRIIAIDLKEGKLKDHTGNVVPSGQDLEDITRVDSFLYLLSSKGLIYEVPVGAKDSSSVRSYPFRLDEKNDFETLYHDPSVNGLIMLCKECSGDDGQKRRSAFRFDLATKTFDTTAFYIIPTGDVKSLMRNDDAKFDPSAARIHPINNKLYILSSAGNLIVIADTRGKVLEAYALNPDKHPQAEGIAFAPNGDMYISNEGKYGKATLQIIPFKNGKK